MTQLLPALLLALATAACAPHGPIVDTGEKPPSVMGTISGQVRVAGSNAPLSAHKVTATELTSGATFVTSTASNGGYTMKVPLGKYRLQVELQPGEQVVDAPSELQINASDLDAGRNFTISIRR
jgi:Carboxypeptidase regulatory-like domain